MTGPTVFRRGYPAYWTDDIPPDGDPDVAYMRYSDDDTFTCDSSRPCAECGRHFSPCEEECRRWGDVHDPCVGHIHLDTDDPWTEIASACCGHGKEPPHLRLASRAFATLEGDVAARALGIADGSRADSPQEL